MKKLLWLLLAAFVLFIVLERQKLFLRDPLATVTVNDLLDGHVVLDLQCLDRIYLNGYVPNLQVGGQVVTFVRRIWATGSRHRRSWRRSEPDSGRMSGRSLRSTTSRLSGSTQLTERST